MGYRSVSLVSAAELTSHRTHFNLEHFYKISKIFEIEISNLLLRLGSFWMNLLAEDQFINH